jgi:hypothetical protein
LVILPLLGKTSNTLGVSAVESIFSSEPATCSPCLLKNFNIAISGQNIYQNHIQYGYETFLNEVATLGVNAGMETGVSSGQISLKDWHNNFGYRVVDLSRRYSYDEHTPVSVEVTLNVASPKDLDLMCFITYNKEITIDLATGALVE